MLALAVAIGPSVTKCRPCSPAHVEPIALEDPVPERRMRQLQRAQLDRNILVSIVLAFVGKRIGREPGADALEGIDENVTRAIVLDLMIFQLVRRYTAADADVEPAV